MLGTVITQKGQATIPQSIRLNYGLVPGSFVQFIEEDNSVRLQAVRPLSMYYGIMKNKKKLLNPDELENLFAEEAHGRNLKKKND